MTTTWTTKTILPEITGSALRKAVHRFMIPTCTAVQNRFVTSTTVMNVPHLLTDKEKQDGITYFKRGYRMSEEEVKQEITTQAVLEAFKLAQINSLPAEVRDAYEAQDSEYDRYSQHTELLVKEGREQGRIEGETRGREQGRIEGETRGETRGREQGRIEGVIEALVPLIRKGNITLDDIKNSDYADEVKVASENKLKE